MGSSGSPAAQVRAVLLDSGGVLLQPDDQRMLEFLRPYGATVRDAEDLDRAHYAVNNLPGNENPDHYWAAFVARCGVPADRVPDVSAALVRAIDASWWIRTVADSVVALRELAAGGVRTAIVSNSNGTAEQLLTAAAVCQVGPGSGVPVETVVDSHIVGIAKPDPRIFEIALDALGIGPEQALHVGDTVWADVRGAQAVGIEAVHLDPYGDCPEPPGDHRDVRSVREVVALVRGR